MSSIANIVKNVLLVLKLGIILDGEAEVADAVGFPSCGRFSWWICCPRVSLRSTPGYLFATLSRASHDVRACPLPIDWDGMLRAGKPSSHRLAHER